MARAPVGLILEMKFPWKIPDYLLSKTPDESEDTSRESEGDESRENEIQEFISDWKKQMKTYVSDQITKIKSMFLKRLRAIEHEVAKHYAFTRRYKKSKPESFYNDTSGEELEMEGSSDDPEDSEAVDPPIDIKGLSDLIEYMSVTPNLESDNVCNIDLDCLQSQFERYCMVNEKTYAKLNPIEVGLRTPLSEAVVHFKSLLEYFIRDLIITEREPELINERQNLNRKFKSMKELMMEYFDPLKIEKESSASKEENFNCLKERINRHLRDVLGVDLDDVTL